MKTLTNGFLNKSILPDFLTIRDLELEFQFNSHADTLLRKTRRITNSTNHGLKTARSRGKFAEILRLQFYDDVMLRVKLWLKRELAISQNSALLLQMFERRSEESYGVKNRHTGMNGEPDIDLSSGDDDVLLPADTTRKSASSNRVWRK